MRIQKFQAATMRDAIAQVKRELGADAVILSTREVRKGLLGTGVEVTAAVDDAGGESLPAAAYGPSARRAPAAAGALSESDVERIMAPLRSELRQLRSMMRPLASRGSAEIREELTALRRQIKRLAADRESKNLNEPSLQELARRHPVAADSRGRVVAMVGATGVGKTTTIGKLAARAALVEQRRVALVSLDTYRVGGEEQIRTYADLIGIPLYIVSDPAQLAVTIESLDHVQRVYVDTAGRSPRDFEAISVLERAFIGIDDVEIHLALPAWSHADQIDATFRRFKPLGIDRLLFTKIDEADDLSQLVRAPVRIGHPVAHFTTGQRVPEDLEDATPARLLDLALNGFASMEVAA